MVPFDTESPFVTSGIRVGTPAVTTRGLKETDMAKVAELVDKIVMNIGNHTVIQNVRKEVNELMANRPLFVW